MATRKTTNGQPQALAAVEKSTSLDTPDRFKLSEAAYLGLNMFNGVSNDELKKELNFPYNVRVYKQMSYHSTINSALTLFDTLVSKVKWTYKPPEEATEEEKNQAKIINQMMQDLQDQTWTDFISDALSSNVFGFSVHEKVFRRRLKANGSKYDDGLIGWRKLPIRNQESIERFLFSDNGNDIIGVRQDLNLISDSYNRYQSRKEKQVNLPRSKFLLFRAGKHKGDPYGKSLLRDAYLAYRFLTVIEEIEAAGVSKDLSGLPILMLPPQYLSADATPQQQQIKAYYENALRNLHINQQSAMILPQAFDPDTRQPLFELKLLSLNGSKAMDTTKIKEYYKNMILMSMFSDVLAMGQGSGGSFALGQIKNSLSGWFVESMLKKIVQVINDDLIRQTYELNNWDTSRLGTMDFDNLQAESIDELGKFFQRVASTSLIEVDREVLNAVRNAIGVDPLPEDLPPQEELMPGFASRAGDGMKSPTGEGTSTTLSGRDNSSLNADNAA